MARRIQNSFLGSLKETVKKRNKQANTTTQIVGAVWATSPFNAFLLPAAVGKLLHRG